MSAFDPSRTLKPLLNPNEHAKATCPHRSPRSQLGAVAICVSVIPSMITSTLTSTRASRVWHIPQRPMTKLGRSARERCRALISMSWSPDMARPTCAAFRISTARRHGWESRPVHRPALPPPERSMPDDFERGTIGLQSPMTSTIRPITFPSRKSPSASLTSSRSHGVTGMSGIKPRLASATTSRNSPIPPT